MRQKMDRSILKELERQKRVIDMNYERRQFASSKRTKEEKTSAREEEDSEKKDEK